MIRFSVLLWVAILAVGGNGEASAAIATLDDEYSISFAAEQVDPDSWVLTYEVENNNQQVGTSMTGLDGFSVKLPDSAEISNITVPDPYNGPPGYWTWKIMSDGWLFWWGGYDESVYPIGSSAVFSFQADGVSLGAVSGAVTTYWDEYTPSYPYWTLPPYGNYTDFSTTLTGPVSLHTPVPNGVWLLASGLIGLVGIRRQVSAGQ